MRLAGWFSGGAADLGCDFDGGRGVGEEVGVDDEDRAAGYVAGAGSSAVGDYVGLDGFSLLGVEAFFFGFRAHLDGDGLGVGVVAVPGVGFGLVGLGFVD